MKVMKRMRRIKTGASMRDERETGIDHHLHTRVTRPGVGDDHAIRGAVLQHIADSVDSVATFKLGNDSEMVARTLDGLTNALNHLTREVDGILGTIQHQRNHIGLAGSQAHPGAIRNIAQLLCSSGDLGTRLGFERGATAQRERYCRQAQPGQFRNGAQGDATAC